MALIMYVRLSEYIISALSKYTIHNNDIIRWTLRKSHLHGVVAWIPSMLTKPVRAFPV